MNSLKLEESERKARKFQELLEKCRVNMRENEDRIRSLKEENENLKIKMQNTTDEVFITPRFICFKVAN